MANKVRTLTFQTSVTFEKVEDGWTATADDFGIKVSSTTLEDAKDRFELALEYLVDSLGEKGLVESYFSQSGVLFNVTDEIPEKFTVSETVQRELVFA